MFTSYNPVVSDFKFKLDALFRNDDRQDLRIDSDFG